MVQSGKYVYPNNFILMNNTRYASFKVLETCSKVIRLGKWTKVHNHCVISLTPALSALARQGARQEAGVIESTTLHWASALICGLFTSICKVNE